VNSSYTFFAKLSIMVLRNDYSGSAVYVCIYICPNLMKRAVWLTNRLIVNRLQWMHWISAPDSIISEPYRWICKCIHETFIGMQKFREFFSQWSPPEHRMHRAPFARIKISGPHSMQNAKWGDCTRDLMYHAETLIFSCIIHALYKARERER